MSVNYFATKRCQNIYSDHIMSRVRLICILPTHLRLRLPRPQKGVDFPCKSGKPKIVGNIDSPKIIGAASAGLTVYSPSLLVKFYDSTCVIKKEA